ncbi:hypothetical protein [Pelomonas cellulosilytica]|uniref:Uncharacterized protein n=1 Tax=Pelomonas cellulosilytica TaxID=2906762 RepID=A0ABS8XR81_9BURK|nr:hypothetical protein [Pelomonas sp. P8]MCE4553258.1 hypothetical protein [Pelomonas sp. P8]
MLQAASLAQALARLDGSTRLALLDLGPPDASGPSATPSVSLASSPLSQTR